MRQRVVLQPADLDVAAEHIVHVQAAGPAAARILDPLGGELGPCPVAVEIGDRQGDVINRGHWPRPCRRRVLIGCADDEMCQRHVLGGDVVGLLALLAERQGDVPFGGADLIQVEDH
jgi:hypothetical protein